MSKNRTPLRYPGGKARLRPYLERLISQNRLYDAHYVEPFCGGAGLALQLLMDYVVSAIHINDLDPAVYAFWESAVNNTDALCDLIEQTPCNMDTWHAQRQVWKSPEGSSILALGFATFFLNRTNRSGILDAGVIGGQRQTGQWKIDARYNTQELIGRIREIGKFRSRIFLYNQEALSFLGGLAPTLPERSLVYLDPPYVEKGPGLYLNHYNELDHRCLATWVRNELARPWMVSYDDHPLVRECYDGCVDAAMNLPYSAYGNARRGTELIYFSDGLQIPDMSDRKSRYHQPWEQFGVA